MLLVDNILLFQIVIRPFGCISYIYVLSFCRLMFKCIFLGSLLNLGLLCVFASHASFERMNPYICFLFDFVFCVLVLLILPLIF